jgi:hypothetical protein
MRAVGMATTAVLAAIAVIVLSTGYKSIPDIRRYLKIRAM